MIARNTMVNNIIATYYEANPTVLEDGMTWYLTGNALITDIANRYDISTENVAAAMSHLSPRTMWSRNVLACERLCAGDNKLSGIMSRNWDMASNALDSDTPLDTLNGPKVSRFARNLLLDTQCVTVDVWAVRVACQDRADEVKLSNKGVYAKIEKAYQVAAGILGIEPAHLQAITWIVVRNGRSS